MSFKLLLSLLVILFPWEIRRQILNKILGYKIHPKAHIGLSIIAPDNLEMGEGAMIGHLNVCKGIHILCMGDQSIISNLNWITGMPVGNKVFFLHKKSRNPVLYLGRHSAITTRHYVDCTDEIRIGDYTTIAGIGSQFLTHSIDLYESRQDCNPVTIGDYCFVGTKSVLLPGSSLGNYSVLAASSLLNKKYNKEFVLIGGVPAKLIGSLPENMKYFSRKEGYVY